MLRTGFRVVVLAAVLAGCGSNMVIYADAVAPVDVSSDRSVANDIVSSLDTSVDAVADTADSALPDAPGDLIDAVDGSNNADVSGGGDAQTATDAQLCLSLDGSACPNVANAQTTCTGGSCGFVCDPHYADCDGNQGNGCEVNLQADPTHCGTCTGTCPQRQSAMSLCASGACTFTCDQGYADCDMLPGDGCEINIDTDVSNCGACGTGCMGGLNAPPSCVGGDCVFVCTSGWGNCDGIQSDGCEANLNTNPIHCGTCDTVCPSATNATPVCSNGVCGVTCDQGYQDCNDDLSDGCEVNVTGDPSNCGRCNFSCPAGMPQCVNSGCM